MTTDAKRKLEQRAVEAAEAALAKRKFVTSIDVLEGMGWLDPVHVDNWRQGRTDYLERAVRANLSKVSDAMKAFRRWARDRGLRPSETVYLAKTRDRRQLQFSKSRNSEIERAYRTHWVSPDLSEKKRERMVEKQSRPPDLTVIMPINPWTCASCSGTGDMLFMEGEGPLCLACADLDHLVFLGSGDAALTRRAKKGSQLSAVVIRFSRSRKRYERQGILVEESALEQAEGACLEDEESRARRRLRDEERRKISDERFHGELAQEIRRLFPGCPTERSEAIARHAGARRSGRVARSAAGRALDPDAVTLAVVASVRHEDTSYDELLMSGVPRADARDHVRADVDDMLERWRAPGDDQHHD
jgi:hypothetical protein